MERSGLVAMKVQTGLIGNSLLAVVRMCLLPPIPAFPRKRGKETLPHAASELTYGSIFLPRSRGRTEEGDSEHVPRRGTASTHPKNKKSHTEVWLWVIAVCV